MGDEKKLSDILQKFNLHAGKIMKVAVAISGDSHQRIGWLSRVFNIARDIDPLCIITRCVDKIWIARDKILNKDMDFFMNDYDTSIYIKNDDNKVWLDELVSMVRNEVPLLSKKEQDYLWSCLNEMLSAVIEYKLIKGEFED